MELKEQANPANLKLQRRPLKGIGRGASETYSPGVKSSNGFSESLLVRETKWVRMVDLVMSDEFERVRPYRCTV
jgi:hypothetical protein